MLPLSGFVFERFQQYNNINIFLKRVKPYQKYGRTQSLEEAIELDNQILKLLIDGNIPFDVLDGDETAITKNVNVINNKISDK